MSATDVSGLVGGLSQPGQAAETPAAPAAQPAAPTPGAGGHARLLSMIQGLAAGIGAFGRAAATQGREGGVADVQAFQQKQQEMQLQQQQNARAEQESQRQQQEFELNMKAKNAALIRDEAIFHHAVQMWPDEMKANTLKLQNEAANSVTNAAAAGYDLADPEDAAAYHRTLDNAIKVNFTADQPPQEVMSSINDAAAKNGKTLIDYVPVTHYNDDKHGAGGSVTLIPTENLSPPATPRQIANHVALIKSTLDDSTAALGADDPDVKALQGKLDGLQQTLAAGGKPALHDLFQIKAGMVAPLATRIAGATQKEKIKQQQFDTAKAQQQAINETPGGAAKLAGAKAAAEQPYKLALAQMEAPIRAGVQNDTEARAKVDSYSKAYVDKLSEVNELMSSLVQAEGGNSAASKAVLAKMLGVTMPEKGARAGGEILRQLNQQGNVPQKFIGSIKDALTGDKWTQQDTENMKEFGKAQLDVAAETLRSNVRIMNVNHKTSVDPEALLQAAGTVKIPQASSLDDKYGPIIKKATNLNP